MIIASLAWRRPNGGQCSNFEDDVLCSAAFVGLLMKHQDAVKGMFVKNLLVDSQRPSRTRVAEVINGRRNEIIEFHAICHNNYKRFIGEEVKGDINGAIKDLISSFDGIYWKT